MKKLLIASMVFLSLSASADLIEEDWKRPGDKLITLDTDAGLEWLDLSQTANQPVNNIYLRTQDVVQPGYESIENDLQGWRIANRQEIESLFSQLFPTLPLTTKKYRISYPTQIEAEHKELFFKYF